MFKIYRFMFFFNSLSHHPNFCTVRNHAVYSHIFRIRFYNYMFFVCTLGASLVSSVGLDDPFHYGDFSFMGVFDVWVLIMTFWFIVDEITEFKR